MVVLSAAGCLLGPAIEGEWLAGILLCIAVTAVEIVIFAGVEYQIKDNMLGVRNFFRWSWFPIDMIEEVRPVRSYLSAAALSADRIAIRFSDRSILRSSMPLEISPACREAFITALKAINPSITVK